MRKLDFYKLTLFGLLLGLLSGTAHAQKGAGTVVFSTDGSTTLVANTASAPVVSHTTLKLNLPPAPKTNAAFYDGSHKDLAQSLAWMQEANASAPTYQNLYT